MDAAKILLILLARLYVAEATYATDVETFFQTFKGSGWNNCINKAKYGKMSLYQGDKKYAVGIINIYTQDCLYDSENIFYKTLNTQMRSGNPDEIWKTAGDLINRAISLVGTQSHQTLYRGCTHDPGQLKSGDKYMFNAITSTSHAKYTAWWFGCGATLIILQNVRGADISKYSVYGGEAEVLVKSTVIFTVARDPVINATEIQEIKKSLQMISFLPLQRIIYLNWLEDCDNVRVDEDTSKPCEICEQCAAYKAKASRYTWIFSIEFICVCLVCLVALGIGLFLLQ